VRSAVCLDSRQTARSTSNTKAMCVFIETIRGIAKNTSWGFHNFFLWRDDEQLYELAFSGKGPPVPCLCLQPWRRLVYV